ncbi:MAG: acyl-CoA dehydrogenase family protein [Bacillota bacterium]
MVDFALSDEQKAFQRLAHEFAEKEIRPVAAQYDESEEFPWDVVRKAAKMGLTSFYFPEKYGGGGVEDRITEFIVAEELAWGCAGIATCILGTGLAAAGIMALGTEEQKDKWIPMFCDENDVKIGAMALTEPEAGSDVQNLKTTAVKDGDEYVLNGVKCFITNGGIADVHVIFATTDPSAGWGGLAAFIVPKGTPGLSMGKKEHKLGVRASHTAEVILQDCRIPAENRLGGEGAIAALGALKMLEYTRPGVGAAAVGIARAALEYATEYAKTRVQFRKPIIAHEGIGFKLADMAVKVDAARLMVWRAGWMGNNNIPFTRGEGSMAKLIAGDVAVEVCIDAIQVLGGYGYMREYPVEKWLRDSKIYQIWEGTAEIQRLVISRALGGRGF